MGLLRSVCFLLSGLDELLCVSGSSACSAPPQACAAHAVLARSPFTGVASVGARLTNAQAQFGKAEARAIKSSTVCAFQAFAVLRRSTACVIGWCNHNGHDLTSSCASPLWTCARQGTVCGHRTVSSLSVRRPATVRGIGKPERRTCGAMTSPEDACRCHSVLFSWMKCGISSTPAAAKEAGGNLKLGQCALPKGTANIIVCT